MGDTGPATKYRDENRPTASTGGDIGPIAAKDTREVLGEVGPSARQQDLNVSGDSLLGTVVGAAIGGIVGGAIGAMVGGAIESSQKPTDEVSSDVRPEERNKS